MNYKDVIAAALARVMASIDPKDLYKITPDGRGVQGVIGGSHGDTAWRDCPCDIDDMVITELPFDEAARTDPRTVETLVRNALNELHIALFQSGVDRHHVAIVNAIGELEKVLKP